MSAKDYFKLNEGLSTSGPSKTLDDLGREVESPEYVQVFADKKDKFTPPVDFAETSNFVKYGSAEQYYEDAIARIYKTYPYDGSLKEKVEWHNSSSYFDEYVFENKYPRTNGYVIMSADGWGTLSASLVNGYGAPSSSASPGHEYIQFKGGPNSDDTAVKLADQFPGIYDGKANVYDAATKRRSNLTIDGASGVSVEFWLKKPAFAVSSTKKEVIFDLWNGELSSSSNYGRLTIELTGAVEGSPFLVTLQSGTAGYFQQSIGQAPTTGTLTSWNHFAFTFVNSASAVQTKFYINGNLDHSTASGSVVGEITSSLIANIGALRTAPSGTLNDGVTQGHG